MEKEKLEKLKNLFDFSREYEDLWDSINIEKGKYKGSYTFELIMWKKDLDKKREGSERA